MIQEIESVLLAKNVRIVRVGEDSAYDTRVYHFPKSQKLLVVSPRISSPGEYLVALVDLGGKGQLDPRTFKPTNESTNCANGLELREITLALCEAETLF